MCSDMNLDMLKDWLKSALDGTHVSQTALAKALTTALGRSIDRAAVNKMVSGKRKIAADELMEIVKFLNVPSPNELETISNSKLRTVTVSSNVQAGDWNETWEWDGDGRYEIAVPLDPSLEGYTLFAAETRGPSMNKRWPEGTIVVFTDAIETQESPIPGKRYVVERKRASGEMEHTVKLMHRDDDGKFWLIPESTDPLHQQPIPVDDGTGSEDEVRIIGQVRYAVTRE